MISIPPPSNIQPRAISGEGPKGIEPTRLATGIDPAQYPIQSKPMGIAPALTAPKTSKGGTNSPAPCTVMSTSPSVIRRTLSAQFTGLGPIEGTFSPKTLCRS